MKHQGRYSSIGVALAFVLFALAPSMAGDLTLAWGESDDAVTAGYEVEVLDSKGSLLEVLDVGEATRVVVTQLDDGELYRFRVRPYDEWGNLASDTSSEIETLPSPRIDAITGEVDPGRGGRLSIEGANFADGAWAVSRVDGLVVDDMVVIRHDLAIVTLRSTKGSEVTAISPEELLIVNPVRKAEAYLRSHPELLDLDGSGEVDEVDLGILESLFGVSRGDALFRPELDPTGDGVIDGEDHAMVRALLVREQRRLRGRP